MLCTAVALIAAGCVFHGRPFVRPQAEALVLGTTTYDDVTRQVGEPARMEALLRNDRAVRVITYAHFYGLRTMSFFFRDDVLIGYHYTSAHPKDTTDFDDSKAYRLKKGQTTRAQVIELLGKPSGTYIYPMISSETDIALVYYHRRMTSGQGFIQKMLIVSLDSSGVVSAATFGPLREK